MGIGQETSPSDIVAPGDNNKERSDNIADNNQNLKENEIELELAGKPWPVASCCDVIKIYIMLLSYCLILLKCYR